MRQLRRLDIAPSDAYGIVRKATIRQVGVPEGVFHDLQRERPRLVAVLDGSALAALPVRQRIDLAYGFPGRDEFARHFPSMLHQVLSNVDPREAPLGVFFRLVDAPNRPYLEPILRANAFEVSREWLRMELPDLPDAGPPVDGVAPGFTLRAAEPADAEAIAELDAAAFPVSYLNANAARERIEDAPVLRVLEDEGTGVAVGFLRLRREDRHVGYISDIALHPSRHRRGLGEAMMRWTLAWLAADGRRRAALTVNSDNAPAIALYKKLGFDVAGRGIDYRRPIDEDEVRQVLERQRRSRITVRRRLS